MEFRGRGKPSCSWAAPAAALRKAAIMADPAKGKP